MFKTQSDSRLGKVDLLDVNCTSDLYQLKLLYRKHPCVKTGKGLVVNKDLILIWLYSDTKLERLSGMERILVPLLSSPPMLIVIVDDTALVWTGVEMKVVFFSTLEIYRKSIISSDHAFDDY